MAEIYGRLYPLTINSPLPFPFNLDQNSLATLPFQTSVNVNWFNFPHGYDAFINIFTLFMYIVYVHISQSRL